MIGFFVKRQPLLTSGLLRGMTDIHAHLLPGVDDGAATDGEALQILTYLETIGVQRLWLTPHVMSDLKRNDRSFLEERFDCFRSTYAGPIELRLGAEYMLDEKFPDRLQEGLLSYDGRHVLVETSYLYSPPDLQGLLYEITLNGYVPVIAHPERYMYMEEENYRLLKERDCLFQLNLLSLSGYYGKEAAVRGCRLLEKGWYDLAGSDIHGLRHKKAYEGFSLRRKETEALRALLARNRELWNGV